MKRDWILCFSDFRSVGLEDVNRQKPATELTAVMDIVAATTGISIAQMKGDKRDRPIARARQIVCYVAHRKFGVSYPRIGKFLGERDHTTILHGDKVISKLVESDERVGALVEMVLTRLDPIIVSDNAA